MSFEFAEGDVHVAMDDSAEPLGAWAARAECEHGLDHSWRRSVPDPGLVAGSCEGIEGEVRGDVDECAGDCGDGDCFERRGITGFEGARPAGLHSLNAPFG